MVDKLLNTLVYCLSVNKLLVIFKSSRSQMNQMKL